MDATYRAVYDFVAEGDGEMSMMKGELYRLVARGGDDVNENEDDDGWTHVQSLTSPESGFVPTDYLEEIVDDSGGAGARESSSSPEPTSSSARMAAAAAGGTTNASSSASVTMSSTKSKDFSGALSLQELAATPDTTLVPLPVPDSSSVQSPYDFLAAAASSSSKRQIFQAPARRLSDPPPPSDPRLNAKLLETISGDYQAENLSQSAGTSLALFDSADAASTQQNSSEHRMSVSNGSLEKFSLNRLSGGSRRHTLAALDR